MNKQDLVATIELSKAEAQAYPLYQAIFERYTNSFQFKKADVSEEALSELLFVVKNIDTAKISFVNQ